MEPWMIEELRRREQEERDRQYVPLQLPLEAPVYRPTDEAAPEEVQRGVVIIELL